MDYEDNWSEFCQTFNSVSNEYRIELLSDFLLKSHRMTLPPRFAGAFNKDLHNLAEIYVMIDAPFQTLKDRLRISKDVHDMINKYVRLLTLDECRLTMFQTLQILLPSRLHSMALKDVNTILTDFSKEEIYPIESYEHFELTETIFMSYYFMMTEDEKLSPGLMIPLGVSGETIHKITNDRELIRLSRSQSSFSSLLQKV